MEERRKYPRFNLTHKVSCRLLENNDDIIAKTDNVSRGGIMMHADDDLKEGQVVNVRIFNKLDPDPVEADAVVVWNRKDNKGAISGLNFTKIGWTDSDKLFSPELLDA